MSFEVPEEQLEICTAPRKVTFRSNLEEYEPDEVVSYASSEEIIEEEEEEEDTVDTQVEDSGLSQSLIKLEVIDEVKPVSEVSHDDDPESLQVTPVIPRKEFKMSPIKVELPPPNPNKYKFCCQQKEPHQIRNLPKYMGHTSEYGLSRQQFQLRMERNRQRRRCQQEIAFAKYQQEVERIRQNEEAFASWIKLKMSKCPKNKYTNRYDEGVRRKANWQKLKISKKRAEDGFMVWLRSLLNKTRVDIPILVFSTFV